MFNLIGMLIDYSHYATICWLNAVTHNVAYGIVSSC